jgi:hypothetical protein
LIESKANIEAKDQDGDTALLLAAREGHAKIAGCLINARATLGVMNKQGQTAVDFALASDALYPILAFSLSSCIPSFGSQRSSWASNMWGGAILPGLHSFWQTYQRAVKLPREMTPLRESKIHLGHILDALKVLQFKDNRIGACRQKLFKILQFGFYHIKQIQLVGQYFGGKTSLTGIVGGYLGKFDWDMVVNVDPKSLVPLESKSLPKDMQRTTPAFKLISDSVAGKKRKHGVSEGSNKKSK